ncbi:hypothetical protein RUM44_003767 [Polyplax serrata]|uniref:Chitin-binding type-2 domain-containing protein n=1 Tax=Polyplax serrata TaxID=468196 RepID=A0ABR1AHE2_POLSC
MHSRCTTRSSVSEQEVITETNECTDRTDGFYPDLRNSCQVYYRCKNGTKVEVLRCPSTQAFAFHLQKCQPKREVLCANLKCHFDNDDFFAVPGTKCLAYYHCRSGSRMDFICPSGTTFNVEAKACVTSGICYEPVCTGRIDGTYPDTTHDCTRSFTCKGGQLEEVNSCPSEQKHDGLSCVPSQVHNCERPEKTAASFHFHVDNECKTLANGTHVVPGTDCRSVRVCQQGKTVKTIECNTNERYAGNRCAPRDMVFCDDVCSMKSDGYHADEQTDCHGYYYCLNGQVLSRKECLSGTAFDGQTCVPENLVSCTKKSISRSSSMCLGLQDGIHPDYMKGCRSFFYCYNHQMVFTESCAEGLVHDGKQCVEEGTVTCAGPKELDECMGRPPGLYQNKTSDCTAYLYCANGRGTSLSCPQGLLFNGYRCVGLDEYTCSSSDECDEQDGYKQSRNTGCRSYYFCFNGNKITYVCPNQMVFNGTQCVRQSSYKCPFVQPRDCVGKTDGYHPDKSSTCKNYYYCSQGEKLTTLTCTGKKVFDGKGCALSDDPLTLCFGPLGNPCSRKHDGVYPDITSECRRYYTCYNRSVTSTSWCPNGFRFNGIACSGNFNCRTTNKCEGKEVGFYQDVSSGCRRYFFCFFNTKTVGICPFGTVFNGSICIDSKYYKCPRADM